MPPLQFIFTTCQVGAEKTLKAEIARLWPNFRAAFSRPGFVTFKLPDDFKMNKEFDLKSIFARSFGYCLGSVNEDENTTSNMKTVATEIWQLADELEIQAVHSWQRDGFRHPKVEQGRSNADKAKKNESQQAAEINNLSEQLTATLPSKYNELPHPVTFQEPARAGQLVLDCIAIDPGKWWIGYHWANSTASRWIGATPKIQQPEQMVSRAYLKMEEALIWSRLPVRPGDLCAEIGCAPGGASQALLQRGLEVIGIDPAKVDPLVLDNPNFRYIQKRGREVRKKEFQDVLWLMADLSIVPNYTLDTIEDIVQNEQVSVQGMLITLKLTDWKLTENISENLERIRSWGYRHVAARQLFHNRQEVCVSVLKSRSLLRLRDAQPRSRKQSTR